MKRVIYNILKIDYCRKFKFTILMSIAKYNINDLSNVKYICEKLSNYILYRLII